MQYLDGTVTAAGGVILRYGTFYGGSADGLAEPVRNGQYPIVGDGAGVTSFIHLDDAASATVLALESNRWGIYNIVDDEPAAASEWVPVLADLVAGEPPQLVSVEQARQFAGKVMVMMATESRGASNAKAKRELGWELRYPSWREGFAAVYGGVPVGAGADR
jgi:nucleoside-diphosphate-sugar epimerase